MYTEENQRGRFPLRDILLKAIIVIIFIILIIFIITRLTTPNNSNNSNSVNSNYDQVFSENLKAMEDAAYSYYTEERLPKEVGDINELTLREMINSNLLEAFTDADGNSCDVNASYIRLTKNEEDYTLRVNLKCNEKEDYSLTKVGEYDYCEHDICKRDSSKENEETAKEEDNEVTDEVDITEETETTTTPATNNSNTNNNTGTTNNSTSNNNSNTGGSSGSSGNSNNTSNNTPQVITMYEYRKVTDPVLSGWSAWSSWAYNTERYSAIKCGTTDANCLREVQLYSRREQVGTSNGRPVYGTVNYYSYRTRTLISSGSTDTKWSTYNDQSLLSQGYTYTGNTR